MNNLPYSFPAPPLPAAASNQPGDFVVVSSAQDIGGGWPLRERPTSDASRYILALADNGDESRSSWGRRQGRLFIAEDESDEDCRKQLVGRERLKKTGDGRLIGPGEGVFVGGFSFITVSGDAIGN